MGSFAKKLPSGVLMKLSNGKAKYWVPFWHTGWPLAGMVGRFIGVGVPLAGTHWMIQKKTKQNKPSPYPGPEASYFLQRPSRAFNLQCQLCACWQRSICKLKFQYHKAGQRRVGWELRGNTLVTGTIAKPGILKFSFIKGSYRNDFLNFLTICSLIY